MRAMSKGTRMLLWVALTLACGEAVDGPAGREPAVGVGSTGLPAAGPQAPAVAQPAWQLSSSARRLHGGGLHRDRCIQNGCGRPLPAFGYSGVLCQAGAPLLRTRRRPLRPRMGRAGSCPAPTCPLATSCRASVPAPSAAPSSASKRQLATARTGRPYSFGCAGRRSFPARELVTVRPDPLRIADAERSGEGSRTKSRCCSCASSCRFAPMGWP